MPEDYQNLFSELGGMPPVDPVVTDPAVVDPNIPPADPIEPDQTDPTIVDPATPANVDPVVPEPAVVDPVAQDATAKAFAEMRVRNTKYQKVFKQMQDVMGVESEDAVIERLLDASYGAQGKQQNIDPAVLKRMSALEEHNQELEFIQRQNFVKDSFASVQKAFNLTNDEVIQFAENLTARNVDIFASNIDLPTLYRGLNFDTISKKAIEAERQNWIKNSAVADKAPSVNPITGKKDTGTKTEINTMADLDLVMKSFKQ